MKTKVYFEYGKVGHVINDCPAKRKDPYKLVE